MFALILTFIYFLMCLITIFFVLDRLSNTPVGPVDVNWDNGKRVYEFFVWDFVFFPGFLIAIFMKVICFILMKRVFTINGE